MASHRYTLTVAAGPDAFSQRCGAQGGRRDKALKGWLDLVVGLMSGTYRGGQVDLAVDEGTSAGGGVAATNTVTYTAPSGAQTIVIMGRTVNLTAGADATSTALAAVAAIQADVVASRMVSATSAAGVVTLTAKTLPGTQAVGNGITLTVTGTGAARGSATFTGGVSSTDAGYPL